ncbi:class I SAM-dependent methyltransferase [Actinokineospora spheciospongiae]|nr:class I SAM-dependent methyltransferase [Actinokineospora spheciospongiae]
MLATEATDLIRDLLAATASADGDVTAAIDGLGVERTARVLVEEVVFRARLGDTGVRAGEAVSVVLALAHRGRELATTVCVGPGGIEVRDGHTPGTAPPPAVIAQDLVEVARALYGPRELVTAATRAIRWPGHRFVVPSPDREVPPPFYYWVVQRVVQVLDRRGAADLGELAVRCGTDKWGALHQYTPHYERHFAPLREHRLTILEIGIGGYEDPRRGGTSLHMWKHFFPRALVHGIDIADKSPLDGPRLSTTVADQSKPEELLEFAERHGPFDIVIDDGSHVSSHVISTFHTLFPHLRPTGLYVIEDLHTAYWPEVFHGDDTDLGDPRFTVGFLKTLVDGLHHEEFLRPGARAPLPTDTQVIGLHLYPNVAVVEKGSNAAGSPVADMLRAARATRS